MPSHEDFEQVFSGGWPQALHAQILDDEEIDVRETLHEIASLAFGLRFREVLCEVERTPDERVVAGANRADGNGHGDVRLADARRPHEERAVMRAHEPRRSQVGNFRAGIFGLNAQSKLESSFTWVIPACLIRRAKRRSARRVSSSCTRRSRNSRCASGAAFACSRRRGKASTMPESRKCRSRVVSCGFIGDPPRYRRLRDG